MKNAMDDYSHLIKNIFDDNDDTPNFSINLKNQSHLISQIYGKKIEKDKLVLASSGVFL